MDSKSLWQIQWVTKEYIVYCYCLSKAKHLSNRVINKLFLVILKNFKAILCRNIFHNKYIFFSEKQMMTNLDVILSTIHTVRHTFLTSEKSAVKASVTQSRWSVGCSGCVWHVRNSRKIYLGEILTCEISLSAFCMWNWISNTGSFCANCMLKTYGHTSCWVLLKS